jgi:hypothetical protein
VNLRDPTVDMRIILKCILVECEGMDQIHVAEDRDHWLALVGTVMYLPFP